jgi:hypothetical protein
MEGSTWVGCHPLHGFFHNGGHVPDFPIPEPTQQNLGSPGLVVTPFIRCSACNPLHIKGTINSSLIYAFPLHAKPQEPEQPIDNLLPWLLALLHLTLPHYDLVVQAVNCDGNWGLGGELECYQVSQQMH